LRNVISDFDQKFEKSYDEGYEAALRAFAMDLSPSDLRALIKEKRHLSRKLTKEAKERRAKHARLTSAMMVYEAVIALTDESPIHVDPVTASKVSDFLEAIRQGMAGETRKSRLQEDLFPPLSFDEHKKIFDVAEIFLMERQFTKLIENKKELIGTEWNLPFDRCSFECRFRHNDDVFHIICVANAETGVKRFLFFGSVRRSSDECWVAFDECDEYGNAHSPLEDGDLRLPFAPLVIDEIRAACILLDAEAIERAIERAPHRLNYAREKRGRLPLYDFHRFALRRAIRVAGDEFGDDRVRNSPRLHLRRGHWRHFSTFKTWIRWQVVGDVSKGFVDKDYVLRLS
jgi:hypothetical protein